MSTPLSELKVSGLHGVGPKLAEKLSKRHLHSLLDLLFHLPLRYQDKTQLTELSQCLPGTEALIEGEILQSRFVGGRAPGLWVDCLTHDQTPISLRFFHVNANQARFYQRGKRLRAFGECRLGMQGWEMMHPDCKVFNAEPPALSPFLTPIYPTTEGLGQKTLQKLVKQACVQLDNYPLDEHLPLELRDRWQLPGINQALHILHQPPAGSDIGALSRFETPAQQRLIVEELFTHQLSLQRLRQSQQATPAPAFHAAQSRGLTQLINSLPFQLTHAQQRVWQEIRQDLAQPKPMQRLVQGDVGSGKTVIAAMAAQVCAEQGYQVAIMAPTEILAEQHRQAMQDWLTPLGLQLTSLSGRHKPSERQHILAAIASGEAQIIVGTHALFQDSVVFKQLGLVIIDEQHRFGVHQRLALTQKVNATNPAQTWQPHQLTMTATPIPRTLAMAAYGDLDLSVIDELPPGRQAIDTAVLSNAKRYEVMDHLYQACQAGVQAYWVCPLIEESEQLNAQAAASTLAEFQQQWPDLQVGLIHGKLKPAEKEQLMADFKAQKLQVLVATTVIEVGVNVPNASLMIIENAERLGLAQLHQLRGRVGRGSKKSHCVLLYQAPLSETAKARLKIMRESQDGFVIAEEDLKIRGPGEVLGTRQTGGLSFRIADISRDQAWLTELQPAAHDWLTHLQHSGDLAGLEARWLAHRLDYHHA
jgi:ATP-dependent DNA helicase RecG